MATTARHRDAKFGRTALLLIDVVNDFSFESGDRLLRNFRPCVPRLRRFLAAARERRIPVVYVNDNFRRWRDSLPEIIRRTTRAGLAGSDVVTALAPGPTDYFILKPRHSGFLGTPLEFLLHALGVRTLVLAGVQTDSCVLFTACDAHMRGYRVVVAADGAAATTRARHKDALAVMRASLSATTPQLRNVRV